MKKYFYFLSFIFIFSCTSDKTQEDLLPDLASSMCGEIAYARSASVDSAKSGPWEKDSTWDDHVPTISDYVYINHSISIQKNAAVAREIIINSSGKLSSEPNGVLTVSEDFIVNPSGTFLPKGELVIGGNLIVDSAKVFFNDEGNSGSKLELEGDLKLLGSANFKNYSGTCENVHIKGDLIVDGTNVSIKGDTPLYVSGNVQYLNGATSSQVHIPISKTCDDVLPLELISFKGQYNSLKKTVAFQWVTADESQMELFYVEHASECQINVNGFKILQNTDVLPKNQSYNTYELELRLDPLNEDLYQKGFHYFRLVQVDNEGKKYSQIIVIKFN
ncbi:MAG: hypothetical protein H6621_09295 [Halobacteriovoraceae bacterium]|nr:hypothetical protein [Halobacteriovoraceae bacterium]MCB9095250.1 hypothetical protein [Halobacteriovoraceae bacterium]